MSQTQTRSVVDQLLTEASQGYVPQGCIADEFFPKLKFAQYTGKLVGYGKNHLRIENNVAGGKGKYRLVEPIVHSTQGFEIETHGLSSILTPRDYKNKTQPFDVEKDEVMGLSTMLMLAKEKGLADTLTSTSIITQNTTLSGTSQFSDFTNSDPVSVIKTAKKAVRDGCGMAPNAMIIPYDVAECLRFHPQLLDMLGYKYAKPGGLTDEDLAKAFRVAKVFIPDAKYNSANEGQTAVMTDVWGKDLVVAVVPDKAEKWQISLGYDIALEGSSVRKVYKNPINNPPNSTEILVDDEYDHLIADATAAYVVKAAIA
jgi:hypothetical protein